MRLSNYLRSSLANITLQEWSRNLTDSQAPTHKPSFGSFWIRSQEECFTWWPTDANYPDMFKILFLEVCLVNCLHNLPLELEPENGALNHCPLFFFKAYFSGDPNGLCLLRTTDSSTRLYGWNRKHALAKSQLTCFIRIANYPFPGVFFFFLFYCQALVITLYHPYHLQGHIPMMTWGYSCSWPLCSTGNFIKLNSVFP